MPFDYRAQAYKWAGPGNEAAVDAVVRDLHYNEPLEMHQLGQEGTQYGACSYCWLRAGRAVHALAIKELMGQPRPQMSATLAMAVKRVGEWLGRTSGTRYDKYVIDNRFGNEEGIRLLREDVEALFDACRTEEEAL